MLGLSELELHAVGQCSSIVPQGESDWCQAFTTWGGAGARKDTLSQAAKFLGARSCK